MSLTLLPLRCKREAFHLIQQTSRRESVSPLPSRGSLSKGLLTLFRDLRRRRLMRRQEDSLPSARPSFRRLSDKKTTRRNAGWSCVILHVAVLL